MNITIVSGRSGSGKSITLNILEDLSYYCIDNLPFGLLPETIKTLEQHYTHLAVSIDARNLESDLANFEALYTSLQTQHDCQIIYIDAEENVLLNRFNETRRKHPLTNETINLKEALEIEKTLLQTIMNRADLTIETSNLTIHQLRQIIQNRIHQNTGLSLFFQSFGFKYSTPRDTDFIFDVRCLPNPYWEKELRHLSGLDKEVINYLDRFKEVQTMYEMIKEFIQKWLPFFEAENRKYLTISIGCTGGLHRSVYLSEKLKNYFATSRKNISIRHRDIT